MAQDQHMNCCFVVVPTGSILIFEKPIQRTEEDIAYAILRWVQIVFSY